MMKNRENMVVQGTLDRVCDLFESNRNDYKMVYAIDENHVQICLTKGRKYYAFIKLKSYVKRYTPIKIYHDLLFKLDELERMEEK